MKRRSNFQAESAPHVQHGRKLCNFHLRTDINTLR